MERVLSNEVCSNLINSTYDWERVDLVGNYYQTFIENPSIELDIETFFGKVFIKPPLVKLLKLEKGDKIPSHSFDFSNDDPEFKRYKGTNFCVQVYLNSDYEGGVLTSGKHSFLPITGYGHTINNTTKNRITPVTEGTAYLLFCYIFGYKSESLL